MGERALVPGRAIKAAWRCGWPLQAQLKPPAAATVSSLIHTTAQIKMGPETTDGKTPTAVVPYCPPQKTSEQMLTNSCRSWFQETAVLFRPCLSYLVPKLLHSRVHQAATPGKVIQGDTQGEQAYLCSSPLLGSLPASVQQHITFRVHRRL